MRDRVNKKPQYKFKFDWRMSLFTLVFLPLLISLGFLQLQREQQKIAAENVYEQRQLAPVVDVATIDWNTNDLNWVYVRASGHFNNERQLLLDNRINKSVVGYEVLTPFHTNHGTLLINRGWIPQGASRNVLPTVDISEDVMIITGHIYVPDGSLMVLGEEESDSNSWPKVVQKVDFQYIKDVIGGDIRPHLIRLDEKSAGVLQTNWSAINMRPEVHLAYAVQWFIMALVLTVLYLLFSFKKTET